MSVCQYCLADSRYTGLGLSENKRCPVCGSNYSGPRRDKEYNALLEAGLISSNEDNRKE